MTTLSQFERIEIAGTIVDRLNAIGVYAYRTETYLSCAMTDWPAEATLEREELDRIFREDMPFIDPPPRNDLAD